MKIADLFAPAHASVTCLPLSCLSHCKLMLVRTAVLEYRLLQPLHSNPEQTPKANSCYPLKKKKKSGSQYFGECITSCFCIMTPDTQMFHEINSQTKDKSC